VIAGPVHAAPVHANEQAIRPVRPLLEPGQVEAAPKLAAVHARMLVLQRQAGNQALSGALSGGRLSMRNPRATVGIGLGLPPLTLDPALMDRIGRLPEGERRDRSEQITRNLFDPANVEAVARSLHLDQPRTSLPPAPGEPQPLVPAGEGPSTPQEGTVGDVVSAMMQVPMVQAVVGRLREQAADRLRRDWRQLSTGEAAAVVTASVALAGGLIAGPASNAGAREAVLARLDGKDIPIGPVTVHIDRPDPNQFGVTLSVDLAQLIPALAR
jgi:hypothetical protein